MVVPSARSEASSIELGLRSTYGEMVTVNMERNLEQSFSELAVFDVHLEDKKTTLFKQDVPGKTLRLIPFEFVIWNSSAACLESDSAPGQIISEAGFDLDVISGCTPGFYLRLNTNLTRAPDEDCIQAPHGCFHFEEGTSHCCRLPTDDA